MARFRKADGFQEGFSLSGFLTAPFRKIIGLMNRDEDFDASQSTFQNIKSILFFPFFILFQILYLLITSWTTTRSGKAFLCGLPALSAIVGVFMGIGLSNYFYKNLVYNRYQASSFSAMSRERYPAAICLLSRLIRENPDEDQLKLTYAMAIFGDGEEDRAVEIMELLAPMEEVGYGPAHQWLSNFYLNQQEISKEERLEFAEKHLKSSLKTQPDNIMAMLSLAVVYDEAFQHDKAINQYFSVIDYEIPPNAEVSNRLQILKLSGAPRLAELLIEKGRPQDADLYLNRAIPQLTRLTNSNPDVIDSWVLLVRCHMARKDFQKAGKTLELALKLSTNPQIQQNLRSIMSELFVQYAKEFEQPNNQADFQNKFSALSRALLANYRSGVAIDQMVVLCLNPETNHENMDSWVRSGGENPPPPEMQNVILGCRSALVGDAAAAESYFQIAESMNPNTPRIINVIAYRMAGEEIDRPEASERLMNIATDVWADAFMFYHTSGYAKLRQNRLAEAEADLKIALEHMPKHLTLRENLVELYDAMGKTDDQEFHQEELDNLRIEAGLLSTK